MVEDKINLKIEELLKQYDPENKLEQYYQLLMQENQKVNLVSRETSRSDFNRLAAESLLPYQIIDKHEPGFMAERYLDIGAGGGFPAIPLILARKVVQSFLVERTAKKAAALDRIIKKLELKAEVLAKNFEELTFNKPFQLITLRYIRLTDSLLKKIFINLTTGGFFIYYASTDLEIYKNFSQMHTYTTAEDAVVKSLTLYRKK